jgi:hypothetical protein
MGLPGAGKTTLAKAQCPRTPSKTPAPEFSSPSLLAQTSNYTSFEATPGKPVQLGYYASTHKDCTPAPLPTIRVIEAPKSGTLTVRRGELKTDQVAGCPRLKIPAQIAFYQARAGASGSDHLVYEVANPTGEVGTYDVAINIKEAPKRLAHRLDRRFEGRAPIEAPT